MKEINLLSISIEEFEAILRRIIREEQREGNFVEPDKYLSVDEASTYLKTTKSTIYKMTMDRTIPFYKPSKKILFKKSELDEWVSNYRIKTVEEIESEASNYLLKNKR